jgi:hypothetical protein
MRIEKGSTDSISIQKTVRNFYLRFGLLEDANPVTINVKSLYQKRGGRNIKFSEELYESEAEVGSKIKELYSELEHQKHLAAICDLTSGI